MLNFYSGILFLPFFFSLCIDYKQESLRVFFPERIYVYVVKFWCFDKGKRCICIHLAWCRNVSFESYFNFLAYEKIWKNNLKLRLSFPTAPKTFLKNLGVNTLGQSISNLHLFVTLEAKQILWHFEDYWIFHKFHGFSSRTWKLRLRLRFSTFKIYIKLTTDVTWLCIFFFLVSQMCFTLFHLFALLCYTYHIYE